MAGGGVARGYRLGYARASTLEQDPRLQPDALGATTGGLGPRTRVDQPTGTRRDKLALPGLGAYYG
jgi:DNA invertase Pin-like site-specific DNA recombinase